VKKKKITTYTKQLNPPEMRFLNEYIPTASLKKSATAARPDKAKAGKDMTVVGGHMLHTNTKIKGALQEIMAAEKLTAFTIAHALSEEIFSKPSDTAMERQVRLKAIEMVCKLGDLFGETKIKEELPIKIVYRTEEDIDEVETVVIQKEDDDGRADSSDTPTESGEGSTE
jgi:hypothetical protein